MSNLEKPNRSESEDSFTKLESLLVYLSSFKFNHFYEYKSKGVSRQRTLRN